VTLACAHTGERRHPRFPARPAARSHARAGHSARARMLSQAGARTKHQRRILR